MIIRQAEPTDLTAIRNLHCANWRVDYAGQLSDSFLRDRLDDYMAGCWQNLPAPPDRVTVALVSGTIAGFSVLRPGRAQGAYLDNLHVSRAARGLGVGAALVTQCAQQAQTAGDHALYLTVMASNVAARRFYAKLGGVEGAIFDDDFDGGAVPALNVRWTDLDRLALTGASEMPR